MSHKINLEERKKDKPADVLSVPLHPVCALEKHLFNQICINA